MKKNNVCVSNSLCARVNLVVRERWRNDSIFHDLTLIGLQNYEVKGYICLSSSFLRSFDFPLPGVR